MRKLGIVFLFFIGMQLIGTVVAYDFYSVFRLETVGSAMLNGVDNIPDIIKNTLIAESILAIILILFDENLNELQLKLKK